MPTATVRLIGPDGATHLQAAIGTGPVDAAYNAIDEIVKTPNKLIEFSIHAITEGIDAIGEVTVRISNTEQQRVTAQRDAVQPRTFGGYGADTDIIVACAKSYLSALNKLLVANGAQLPVAQRLTRSLMGITRRRK